jgi:hypothetical protein
MHGLPAQISGSTVMRSKVISVSYQFYVSLHPVYHATAVKPNEKSERDFMSC